MSMNSGQGDPWPSFHNITPEEARKVAIFRGTNDRVVWHFVDETKTPLIGCHAYIFNNPQPYAMKVIFYGGELLIVPHRAFY